MDNPPNEMNTAKVAVIAMLIALVIATNYALMPVYNVKLMDTIVFVSGFCFGPLVGAVVGALSWAIYGTLNPFGFSINILAATMISEALFGVVGGLLRRGSRETATLEKPQAGLFLSFALIGVLLTFVYDVATNIAF